MPLSEEEEEADVPLACTAAGDHHLLPHPTTTGISDPSLNKRINTSPSDNSMIHPDEIEQTSIKRQQIDRYYSAVSKATT